MGPNFFDKIWILAQFFYLKCLWNILEKNRVKYWNFVYNFCPSVDTTSSFSLWCDFRYNILLKNLKELKKGFLTSEHHMLKIYIIFVLNWYFLLDSPIGISIKKIWYLYISLKICIINCKVVKLDKTLTEAVSKNETIWKTENLRSQ